ncbi:hypothetical protein D3C71_1338800 [compost metagenome]
MPGAGCPGPGVAVFCDGGAAEHQLALAQAVVGRGDVRARIGFAVLHGGMELQGLFAVQLGKGFLCGAVAAGVGLGEFGGVAQAPEVLVLPASGERLGFDGLEVAGLIGAGRVGDAVQCLLGDVLGIASAGVPCDQFAACHFGAGVLLGVVQGLQELVAYGVVRLLQLGQPRAQVGAKAREDALADVGVGVQRAQGRAELGHHLLVGGLGQQQFQGGDLGGAGVGRCCLGAGSANGWVLGGDLQGFGLHQVDAETCCVLWGDRQGLGVRKVDAQTCCVLRSDQQRLGLCLHHQGQCGAGGLVGGGEEGGAGQGRVSVGVLGVGLALAAKAAWAAVGKGACVVLGLVWE